MTNALAARPILKCRLHPILLQAVKLLAEFWSCSPEDYDSQYASNSKSVRQAGEVVALLAELLPKVRRHSCPEGGLWCCSRSCGLGQPTPL